MTVLDDRFGAAGPGRALAIAVFLAPLAAVALMTWLKLVDASKYAWIIREDGPVEWLTVAVYLVATVLAVRAALLLRRQGDPVPAALYLVFAAGLFLIAGEEASWGQRQLGFGTPEAVATVNTKNEFNFHNTAGFPLHLAFIAVGLYGAFGRPVWARLFGRGRLCCLFTAPVALSPYFLITALLYVYYEVGEAVTELPAGVSWPEYLRTQFVTGKDQEPVELILAAGFLLFTVHVVAMLREEAGARRG